ncbi:MAG: hypothetical protein KDC79_12300 [Cyclobacteriaceae bacterium]|nr:hypothetical protein [Cyclobacteriaceae bacterium]
MKYFVTVSFLAVLGFMVTCKTSKVTSVAHEPTLRQIKPSEVMGYHDPMNLNIAWYPYEDLMLKQTKDNNWVVVKSDSTRKSAIPVILITYPGRPDSIWVQMDTENALLGKLIKHSLMTKEPIHEPFGEFFAEAKCTKCHPSNVIVDFEK